MILLTEVSDIEEYYRLILLFESKGVLVHTGNEDTARTFGVFHPVGKYGLFILLEEQYNDAQQLLLNENHDVEKTVDIDLYQQHKQALKDQALSSILTVLSLVAIVALFVLFGVLFFSR